MTTRTACFDSGGGARRRRSIRQVWQGRRLDGRARSLAVDLLQPARLQRFPDGRDLGGADHLRNGARHRARRFRRLTALMERGDAFIRPSHVRSNVTAADICANETAPESATTLAFSQPQTSARRPASTRRTLDHLARRSRYDQAHARSVEYNGQIDDQGVGADPFRRLAQSPGCDIQMCVNDRTANAPARALVHRAGFPDPPVLREPFPRWNFLLPTISRAWEAACSTPRRTASIV